MAELEKTEREHLHKKKLTGSWAVLEAFAGFSDQILIALWGRRQRLAL